jgi:ribosomal protein L11 methyltransferase
MAPYWQLRIEFESEEARALAAEILPGVLDDLGALGLEEPPAGGGATAPLIVFFPPDIDPDAVLELTRKAIARFCADGVLDAMPVPSIHPLRSQDWVARFRRGFRGVAAARGLRIVPPWLAEAKSETGAVRIVIDPGSAFGTGLHESTRLALRLLQQEIRGGERVADFGAGSGILSIAAVRLGARSAWAVEVDEQARQNLRDNIRLNRVARQVHVFIGDGAAFARDSVERGRRFDLVVCNMLPERMEPLLPLFPGLLDRRKGGRLVIAGHLQCERPLVAGRLKAIGAVIEAERRIGDWAGLTAGLEG